MKDLPITMIPEGWMEKTGGYAKDMTLRDYFAAKAMQGIMMGRFPITSHPGAEHLIARAAYIQADAMIKAGQ